VEYRTLVGTGQEATMSTPLHPSLRPKTNLTVVGVCFTGCLVMLWLITPRPFAALIYGCVAGLIGGLLQTAGITAGTGSLLAAQTALEVRQALRSTRWGKCYLYYYWAALSFGLLAVILHYRPPALSAAAFFIVIAFTCVRDIVTLPATFRLAAMADTASAPPG
jgi:hypothetical protein